MCVDINGEFYMPTVRRVVGGHIETFGAENPYEKQLITANFEYQ